MKRLLVLVVFLAACGGPAAESAAPRSAAPEPSAPAGPDAPATSGGAAVPAALEWSVDRIGGGQIDGGDLAGRDVVLWFWAPW